MKISWNWLCEMLPENVQTDFEQACQILTSIGLEVEGTEDFESVPGALEGIVVGKVLECGQHPNADRLSLTRVDIGQEDPVSIVCGAPNVAAGQTVAVATVGATLYPEGGDPFEIKKAKIRGEHSYGMICAEDEIGLGQSHEGIMVLDDEWKAGTPLAEVFEIEKDHIIDIGLTPNRGDATSHLGVARDLMAALRAESKNTAALRLPARKTLEKEGLDNWKVVIENEEACPRYCAIVLEDIKVGPSPQWIQNRLKSLGINSINNIVDITNLVMLELGQPLHAFDADVIADNTVRVGFADENTPFICLDEKEVKLAADDLVIKDGQNKPMCIAGVYGGKEAETWDSTSTLFLESAFFDPAYIRKTSMRHLLRTNAAIIYEKHADPEICVIALERAAALLEIYADARIRNGVIDEYPNKIQRNRCTLRATRVKSVAGAEVPSTTIEDILTQLEIEFKERESGVWDLSIPAYRSDVTREIDVVEEIIRLYGYDNIGDAGSMQFSLASEKGNGKYDLRRSLSQLLTGSGYSEVMNVSITKDKYYEDMEGLVLINNTSNTAQNVMRPDMVHPVLENLIYNVNRQMPNLKVFEFGRVYTREGESISEKEQLIVAVTGQRRPENWITGDENDTDIYDLTGLLQGLFDKYSLSAELGTAHGEHQLFHPAFEFRINEHSIAQGGKLRKEIIEKLDLDKEVFAGVVEFEELHQLLQDQKLVFEEPGKYPSIERHLAIRIKDNIKFSEIQSVIRKRGGKLVSEIGLFDVYIDDAMRESKEKSYAISIVFSRKDRTLNDGEIEKVMDKILKGLNNDLSAIIRK